MSPDAFAIPQQADIAVDEGTIGAASIRIPTSYSSVENLLSPISTTSQPSQFQVVVVIPAVIVTLLLFVVSVNQLQMWSDDGSKSLSWSFHSSDVSDILSNKFPTRFVPVPPNSPTGSYGSSNFTLIYSNSKWKGHGFYLLKSSAGISKSLTVQIATERSLELPSVLARRFGCRFAVNGGPYDDNGSPIGSLVINGSIRMNFSSNFVGFGVTKKPNHIHRLKSTQSWVLGSLSQQHDLDTLQDFVTGFRWLIYEGINEVNDPNDSDETGSRRAARSAIGVDSEGHLLIFVADGCENCLSFHGPTLREVGDVLVSEGAQCAVNLDGGGSSVLVGAFGRQIISHPTCLDLNFECERPVANILCLN